MDLAARYDLWHTLQTIVPLVAGGLGALLVWHRPAHLGKVVLAYAVICIGVALSPNWVGDGERVAGALPEVLLETKFAFIVGLAIVLASGGRDRGADRR